MRTLVFGAKGQLGRDLVEVFHALGDVQGLDLPEVNIADEPALYQHVDQFRPNLILNAAAYTNVEAAEDDFEAAFLTNEAGARNVAEVADYLEVPVVYFSTDYVFDGEKRAPYHEDDAVNPAGVYARSKAAGETAVRKFCHRHFIIRTAWLYGPGGNNFVEKILRAAAAKPELAVVDDEVGAPTYTRDLAEATAALAATDAFGTYHVTNSGHCSRFECAQAILGAAGLDIPVRPVASHAYPTRAPRPTYSVLDMARYTGATGRRMRHWEEALVSYVRRRDALAGASA
ncbi:MAG: dTDP-4-dehydrorhamnose reductase [Candidatus Hydrogenedentes bacterium]|nr:dTDP-4-dehydrorhamnose reductase [Candidatus Hydrogenedentota bacterium]